MQLCGYNWRGNWGVGPSGNPPNIQVDHFCIEPMDHIERHRCHCGLQTTSGVAAPMVDPERGVICWWQPIREYAAQWPAECPQCGHSTLAHVGVEKCPVCVLIYHGTEQWRRMQARLHGLSWPR